MSKNWIGTIVLIGTSIVGGLFFSQIWEQVLGQPTGFSVETPQQVVVNHPAEVPKWYVDFVPLSPQMRVITIVDTETKKIAVYHEELATGGVKLVSVRGIQEDLMFSEFNALPPLPTVLMRERQQSKGKN